MIQKVSIIIPVFNESATVSDLLTAVCGQELPGSLTKEIIIVESGSTDGSRQIVETFVRNHSTESSNLRLIQQDTPRGKGFAVREGLAAITGDIVMIQDADLEYNVADYPSLLQPIINGHADFVLGSRHLSAGNWKIRRFEESPVRAAMMNLAGSMFHTFFNIVYGVKLTDPTTMYKVFLADCVRGVHFEANRFDFDFELVAKLLKLGYNPLEVPVAYQSRGFAKGKKIRFFRDPLTYVHAIIKFRFKRIKRDPKYAAVNNPRSQMMSSIA
jgi:glycosyltransferase involved in cell wall biosynthesis